MLILLTNIFRFAAPQQVPWASLKKKKWSLHVERLTGSEFSIYIRAVHYIRQMFSSFFGFRFSDKRTQWPVFQPTGICQGQKGQQAKNISFVSFNLKLGF